VSRTEVAIHLLIEQIRVQQPEIVSAFVRLYDWGIFVSRRTFSNDRKENTPLLLIDKVELPSKRGASRKQYKLTYAPSNFPTTNVLLVLERLDGRLFDHIVGWIMGMPPDQALARVCNCLMTTTIGVVAQLAMLNEFMAFGHNDIHPKNIMMQQAPGTDPSQLDGLSSFMYIPSRPVGSVLAPDSPIRLQLVEIPFQISRGLRPILIDMGFANAEFIVNESDGTVQRVLSAPNRHVAHEHRSDVLRFFDYAGGFIQSIAANEARAHLRKVNPDGSLMRAIEDFLTAMQTAFESTNPLLAGMHFQSLDLAAFLRTQMFADRGIIVRTDPYDAGRPSLARIGAILGGGGN
jgi:hypothetical protein